MERNTLVPAEAQGEVTFTLGLTGPMRDPDGGVARPEDVATYLRADHRVTFRLGELYYSEWVDADGELIVARAPGAWEPVGQTAPKGWYHLARDAFEEAIELI